MLIIHLNRNFYGKPAFFIFCNSKTSKWLTIVDTQILFNKFTL